VMDHDQQAVDGLRPAPLSQHGLSVEKQAYSARPRTPPMYLVSPDRVFSLFPLFSPFLLSRNIKFSTPVRNGIVTEYFAFTTSPS